MTSFLRAVPCYSPGMITQFSFAPCTQGSGIANVQRKKKEHSIGSFLYYSLDLSNNWAWWPVKWNHAFENLWTCQCSGRCGEFPQCGSGFGFRGDSPGRRRMLPPCDWYGRWLAVQYLPKLIGHCVFLDVDRSLGCSLVFAHVDMLTVSKETRGMGHLLWGWSRRGQCTVSLPVSPLSFSFNEIWELDSRWLKSDRMLPQRGDSSLHFDHPWFPCQMSNCSKTSRGLNGNPLLQWRRISWVKKKVICQSRHFLIRIHQNMLKGTFFLLPLRHCIGDTVLAFQGAGGQELRY